MDVRECAFNTRYKLYRTGEFFDLAADPAETRNLADDPVHQAALKDLRGRLTARMKATGDHAISWLGGDAAR